MAVDKSDRTKAAERGPRGKYTPDLTRSAILDSALHLFESQGFHATSVQAIADRAEVTKGAFYHHFDSKETLLQIIHDEFVDNQLGRLEEIVKTIEPADQKLRALIEMSVMSVIEYREHVAVYFQERRYLRGERFEAVKRKRAKITRLTEGIVVQGIEDGVLRADIDPRVTTFAVVGMTAWTYQWLRPRGPVAPEVVSEMLADMVLVGLLDR